MPSGGVHPNAFPHAEAGMARSPDYILVSAPPPVVLAYGIGVDSTALSVENRLAHMAIAV
jgi:hypothetical protein